ncbi:MAG: dihydropteroate synthase [Acidimicrobiales bacterium]
MGALVMGVVNVTPDSFSDGGRFSSPSRAVAHGRLLAAAGASIIDVGGESTRPGAEPVEAAEELRRVLPVVSALAADGTRVSIDTRHAEVADAALAAGATIVNDVSAAEALMAVAAAAGAGYVAMHAQGDPATMQLDPWYDDVVGEVHGFLAAAGARARQLGCPEVWVDPGIGFGKTLEHNLALLAALPELVDAGVPVVVGASRKGFLGRLTGGAPVEDRLEASVAVATWAFHCGVQVVRAHDVAETVQALRLTAGEAA